MHESTGSKCYSVDGVYVVLSPSRSAWEVPSSSGALLRVDSYRSNLLSVFPPCGSGGWCLRGSFSSLSPSLFLEVHEGVFIKSPIGGGSGSMSVKKP
uniref:Uncharacterized protein n=1 Tax=Setaria italica TaxID=4555 RepID=K3YX27_SETIT